jgi:hypothetical protein
MDSNANIPPEEFADAGACPLTTPLLGRIPGVLAVASIPVSLFLHSRFFILAGGLLAVISLLMSPPRSRILGLAGLAGAVLVGVARLHY